MPLSEIEVLRAEVTAVRLLGQYLLMGAANNEKDPQGFLKHLSSHIGLALNAIDAAAPDHKEVNTLVRTRILGLIEQAARSLAR